MNTQYTNKFAISQTAMKDWKELPPQRWYETWITRTRTRPRRPTTSFGSYLDCLMFTPQNLEKRFMISDIQLPSENVTKITNEIFDRIKEINDNITKMNSEQGSSIPLKEFDLLDKDLVTSICIKNDYYKNKPTQAYNEIVKNGTSFFEFLKIANGRTIITNSDKSTAETLKEKLLSDPISKGLFIPKKNCEVIFQQAIYTNFEVNYENIELLPVKGALDDIHFNHKRKEVREVDLKCTESAFAFDDPFQGPIKRFDYIGQHSFYDYLLGEWLKTYKDGAYADYTVMNPLNVVIDTDLQLPYIYEYQPHDLHIKRFGIENTKIKGWEDTLREIAFHLNCQDWSRPIEHIKNGKIIVQAFAKR